MNAFEILGIPVRLAWSDEELRTAFREAGKREHPDAGGAEGAFQHLQDAYARLASPRRRLKHWLELREIVGDERGVVADALLDVFGEVGSVIQAAEAAIRKREEARSALAKALIEPEIQRQREAVEKVQGKLGSLLEKETGHFLRWDESGLGQDDPWRCVRDLAFLEKWQGQLRAVYGQLL